MHPVPRPPKARPVYALGHPRNIVMGVHNASTDPDTGRTMFTVTVDDKLTRLAILKGGLGRKLTRNALRDTARTTARQLKINRYDRVTINSEKALHILGPALAYAIGPFSQQLGITRTMDTYGHPLLERYAHTEGTPPEKTGMTNQGTFWELTSTKDIGGQVVVHTDAAGARGAIDVGCGWLIEATRLAEPMGGTARHGTPKKAKGHRIMLGELLAIQHGIRDAIEVFPKAGTSNPRPLYVYSDSELAIEFLLGRIKGESFPLMAHDIRRWWQGIHGERPALRLFWIRGHNGHAPNEAADALAKSALK